MSSNPSTGAQRRFPLEWPTGWKRTPSSKITTSLYKVTPDKAIRDLFKSAKLLGARNVVLSTNVTLRKDGMPHASAPHPGDAGVAFYWTSRDGKPRVIACDTWKHVHENIRAIGLTLDALRTLERTGASQVFERAFTGFAALPASTGRLEKRHWREVMEFGSSADLPWIRAVIHDRYRMHARRMHPDVPGGSHEAFIELEHAYQEAKRELGDG